MVENIIEEHNKKTIENAIIDCINQFEGMELVEIRYFKEFGKFNLTVFIWKKEGITLDDCENVHKLISDKLDEYQDMFLDEYVLNVSSPGLDREIKSNDDLRRALDTEIQIIKDKKKSHGVLKSFDDDNITILSGDNLDKERTILRNKITKIQPYIRF